MPAGNVAGLPAAIRHCCHRTNGVMPAALPPECPAKLPANFRDVAGKLANSFPAFFRQITGILPLHFRRTSAVITGAIAGQFPASFPSYARH